MPALASQKTTPGLENALSNMVNNFDYFLLMAYVYQYGLDKTWHGAALKATASDEEKLQKLTVSYGAKTVRFFF